MKKIKNATLLAFLLFTSYFLGNKFIFNIVEALGLDYPHNVKFVIDLLPLLIGLSISLIIVLVYMLKKNKFQTFSRFTAVSIGFTSGVFMNIALF